MSILHWIGHAVQWTWHDSDGYNLLSGPIPDLTLLGGLTIIYRRLNCHAKGCRRIGLHHVDGTPYRVCAPHHPSVPDGGATASHIHGAHLRSKGIRT